MATDRSLHKYSLAEELISSISHGIGALFAILAGIFAIIKAVGVSRMATISISIYIVSMVLLFTISTIYHSLAFNNGKKVLRILDHCFIYVLIFGTIAPVAMLTLSFALGISVIIVSSIAGIVGIVFSAIDFKKYSKLTMICYIAMGWSVIIAFNQLFNKISLGGILLVFLGGVVYTLGAVLYAIGKHRKYMHSIWHIFVLIAAAMHFLAIYLYVLEIG